MPRVQVIVPNWNGRHFLPRCLGALAAQSFADWAVTVVDNGSTDGSVAWLREHAPAVQVIANAANQGFAAAINQGIRASESEYVATLNNDTEPERGWLEALVAAADSDEGVGMCASKMLFAAHPHLINSAGICIDPVGIAWDCQGGQVDRSPDESTPAAVFGPCAGAALYRRAMLDQVGLFDEDFFAYLEDVDLAWRGRLAGWRALYVPQARVYHVHSGTLGEGSPLKSFFRGRNKVWLIVKNYPMPWFALYLPLILLYDLGAVCYVLLAKRDVHALKGRWAGLAGLPGAWSKRRTVQALRKIGAAEWPKIIHPLDPPWRIPRRYQHLGPATAAE